MAEKKPKGKDEKGKKGKATGEDEPLSLRSHPRASISIRRWKARAALGGFALSALASTSAGAPLDTTLGRALLAGVVANLAGWFLAVALWRHVLRAEMKAAIDKRAAMTRTSRAPGQ